MAIFEVSTRAGLISALGKASGGDVIQLSGGSYGQLSLKGMAFSSTVSIVSKSGGDPAVFTGLSLDQVKNIAFDGVTFDYQSAGGAPTSLRPFAISSSENVAIRNSTFDGDSARGVSASVDGFATGVGLSIRESANVTVENNAIFNFLRGIVVAQSSGVDVVGNNLHSLRSDGMNFVAVTDVVIEDNWIHDFRLAAGSGDHSDMIQFWTAGTSTPSTDIVIRGNRLDIGEGDRAQSIFLRNELVDSGQAGLEMFYRNVLIEDNVIVNAHLHGITVGETLGLTIRNNTVLHNDGGNLDGPDSGVEIPRIFVAQTSSGVIIANNLTAGISGHEGQPDWTVSGNVLVQDQNPFAAGYYNDVFLTSSMQGTNGFHAYIILPGSMAAGAGAAASQPDVGSDLVAARFHVTSVKADGAALDFNATFSTALPSGTVYEWDFGDGSPVTQGAVVRHKFPAGGMYDVNLTLRLPDGTVTAGLLKVGIAGSDVLQLGPDGRFTAYGYGTETDLGIADPGGAKGIKLGATGVTASVASQYVEAIGHTDEITIKGALRADSAASAGELFRVHGSFIASVTASGELLFRYMKAGGGEASVITSGAGLNDLALHSFMIKIKGKSVTLSTDGGEGIKVDMGAAMGWSGSSLNFGNPWGSTNFSGTLRSFSIAVDASDYTGTGSSVVLKPGLASGTGPLPLDASDTVILIDGLKGAIPSTGGIDEVQSALQSIDLTKSRFNGIENATLLGTLDLSLLGDEQNNRLVGNDGNNILNGGKGADTLIGGLGDDLYIVDNPGDRIIEGGNGGIDRVGTSVSLKLADNLEHAFVQGRAPVNLTGNVLDNYLSGNGSANILDGGGGADTMVGGRGSDVYVVDDPGDVVVERKDNGIDTVRILISHALPAQVENGVAIGTAAVNLKGNGLANMLIGNSAANVIDGGAGNDRLTGGGDADVFVFRTGSQRDVVTDFAVTGPAHDVIDLRGLISVTGFADLLANHLVQSGDSAVIRGTNGDVLTLLGVAATDLTADHFLF